MKANIEVVREYENVEEPWLMYDTVLIGINQANLRFPTGYHNSWLVLGNQSEIPFFNARNKNSGLPYNNQEQRDSLPWPFRVFGIGLQWFSPSTALYRSNQGEPDGAQSTELNLWETEINKHCELVFQTNQDERLRVNCAMAPSGVGPHGGGMAQGDMEATSDPKYPNTFKTAVSQSLPMLTNKWPFPNPIEVPRTVNLSARIVMSSYARALLTAMPGPFTAAFMSAANDGTYVFKNAYAGVRCFLIGQRLLQQRGQYHA